jgi:hypothetical protein
VSVALRNAGIVDSPVNAPERRKLTKRLKLYHPHPAQMVVHQCGVRYRVIAFGRQAGKSTWGLNELLRHAWEHPNTTYWFISPTFDQAKKQYRRLVGMLSPCWSVLKKKNQTELRVKLITNSVIEFKSGEVLHNLRGETLHGCIIDELREQPRELWAQIINPMLRTTSGWCAFISTPNGFDHFYDLAEKAKNDTRGKWAFFEAPSTANPLFTQEEFEDARHEMSEAEFEQEILAKFRNIFSGRTYSSESTLNRLLFSPFCQGREEMVSRFLPVTIALDFNVNPMSWHLGQFRGENSYWFDEIHVADTNTEECSRELVEKLVALKDAGLLLCSPMVQLCGDATGNSRNTKATQSDYDLIKRALDDAGITWTDSTPAANPPVKQRVNTMNSRLCSAAGVRTLFYHPGRCPWLAVDFERVSWKEGVSSILDQSVTAQIGNKTFTVSHASDGVGYAVCVYAPIELHGGVGKMLVVKSA